MNFAYAAALVVAESKTAVAKSNPLFLYSVGLINPPNARYCFGILRK